MTEFKIGDVVRIETDKADSLRLVIRGINYSTSHAFLCVSECGKRIRWSAIEEMELVHRPDPQADLKQVIREVLLGDEFMKAFAAAFMKTPLPMAMPCDDRGAELIKSLADYPFGEPTKAQQLADRTLKAIWQANDGGTQ